MKRLIVLLAGVAGFSVSSAMAVDAPRGNMLELHSCEVYAGPCVINGEAPQEGRYMVRAWDINGGSFQGTDLTGLQVGVLQLSTDNLATRNARSGKAVIYLPEKATPAQRDALVGWLKASQADFRPTEIQTRVAPLQFTKTEAGYTFTAGEFVSVKSAALPDCGMGGCGEELWYQPRSAMGIFTVAKNGGTQVSEPLVQLTWSESGRRSVFLGRFGGEAPARSMQVSLAELCGSDHQVF